MATFKSIKQTAKMGVMSENYIRQLVAAKKCPGVYAGTHFMVNVEALVEQLDAESRKTAEVRT